MRYLLPILALILMISYYCKPTDSFDTSSGVMLGFSVDTLRFDTVFTELGSATRILKVYNQGKKDIQINKISIKNETSNFYKINVDGIPGNVATDIEIAGNDSLYIFAEVTIDPNQPLSNSPFVIEDYLVFEINGNIQEILLESWGQNANYFPDRFSNGGTTFPDCSSLPGGNLVLDDPKPYVFYGTVVFTNCNVTMPAGTRVHVHGGIVPSFDANNMRFFYNDGRIIFAGNSTLNIEGSQDNPVIISGDRLEESFDEVAGQWWGIYLTGETSNHSINHLELKNSIVGVVIDSAVDLTIENSKIYNTANAGLIGIHASVDATNCLFYNNGSNAVRFLYGGDYNFTYCTLASYGVDAPALSMTNLLCGSDDPLGCSPCFEYRLNALFKNSIIFGSRRDEISMVNGDACVEGLSSPMNYKFEDCIVRVDELLEQEGFEDFFTSTSPLRCNPCQNADNNDAIFEDPNEDVYYLDTLSIAEMKAVPISSPIPIFEDLDGNLRDGSLPDLGCYEYQY